MTGVRINWSADRYASEAGFVAALGEPVLDLLRPVVGERILDLGCGDGALTAKIAASGASIVGADASPEMVDAARRRGLDARVIDARSLPFSREFDAVFSNAALHWMGEPGAVLAGVRRALKTGGRFVGEMGGHGNIAAIRVAVAAALKRRGGDETVVMPKWYFPTKDEYRSRLAAAGFAIEQLDLFARPTPLSAGMANWLELFGESFFRASDVGERTAMRDEIVAMLRPALCDRAGNWTADYVRLRFAARAI